MVAVRDWSTTPASNTTVDGVNIAENCPYANMNNMGRSIMAGVRSEVAHIGANVASAAVPDISIEGGVHTVTGTTTVTGFATAVTGLARVLHYVSAVPHINSTALGVPGGASLTIPAGAIVQWRSLGAGNWRAEYATRADGKAVVSTVAAADVPNDLITYAKIQNVTAASRLLGRGSAGGAGDVEEITLGSGLSMSATALSATGRIAQVVRDSTATYTTCATDMPVDNSIPQITEGDEILSVAITPVNSSSIIQIRFQMFAGATSIGQGAAALFVGTTANALAAAAFSVAGSASYSNVMLEHTLTAGSTAARTYRIRVGPDAGSPASIRVNGDSATRIMGGVGAATLEVMEILP